MENNGEYSLKNVVKNENIQKQDNTEKPKKNVNNIKKEDVLAPEEFCGPACASFIVATIILVILQKRFKKKCLENFLSKFSVIIFHQNFLLQFSVIPSNFWFGLGVKGIAPTVAKLLYGIHF
jgi:hypothetical protein